MAKKSTFLDNDGPLSGVRLSAGGLTVYDDNGFWVVKERGMKPEEWMYSDCGGRYEFADCDIVNTIVREFQEETYYAFPFSVRDLEGVKIRREYIIRDQETGNPTYLAMLVHADDVPFIKMDPKAFESKRQKCLESNEHNVSAYFPSFELVFLPFKEVQEVHFKHFGYRLRQIYFKWFPTKTQ